MISLGDIENWFLKESEKINEICEFKKRPSNLFQTIMDEFNWESLINSSNILSFEHAKKYFRGKEAFDYVYEFIKEKSKFQHLSKQDLKREILCKLMDSAQSSIYSDLENLLQAELNIKSLKTPENFFAYSIFKDLREQAQPKIKDLQSSPEFSVSH